MGEDYTLYFFNWLDYIYRERNRQILEIGWIVLARSSRDSANIIYLESRRIIDVTERRTSQKCGLESAAEPEEFTSAAANNTAVQSAP